MNALSPLKLRRVRLVAIEGSESLADAPVVGNPEDVARIGRAVLPTDREGLIVIHLDTRNRVRSVELVSIGALNSTLAHPREIFKGAILANAASIIVAHNHPSGDPTPSDDDWTMTDRLSRAGDVLGIELADHVIVTRSDFRSLRRMEERGER